MVFSIIPKVFEDELLVKPEFTKTYHDIIKWCRQKCQIMRTRELADVTRGPTASSTHAKAMRKRIDEDHLAVYGDDAVDAVEAPPSVEEPVPS